jgi:hypothetical protein
LTKKVTKKVKTWTFANLFFIFFNGIGETPSSFFAKKSYVIQWKGYKREAVDSGEIPSSPG